MDIEKYVKTGIDEIVDAGIDINICMYTYVANTEQLAPSTVRLGRMFCFTYIVMAARSLAAREPLSLGLNDQQQFGV